MRYCACGSGKPAAGCALSKHRGGFSSGTVRNGKRVTGGPRAAGGRRHQPGTLFPHSSGPLCNCGSGKPRGHGCGSGRNKASGGPLAGLFGGSTKRKPARRKRR